MTSLVEVVTVQVTFPLPVLVPTVEFWLCWMILSFLVCTGVIVDTGVTGYQTVRRQWRVLSMWGLGWRFGCWLLAWPVLLRLGARNPN